MKKVSLVCKPQDSYVETLSTHLKCARDCVEIVSDPDEADIVLVCLTPALLSDSELLCTVESLLAGGSGERKVVIPIKVRKCLWESRLPMLAQRQSSPRKWFQEYGSIDEGDYAVAEMVVDMSGRQKILFKD